MNKPLSIEDIVKKKKFTLFIKRLFDITVSFIGFIILLPLMLFIALSIFLSTKSHPLFIQARAGKNNKIFKIVKFKTMKDLKTKTNNQLSNEDAYRITPIGKFLRKTKLDELPQLFNVLKGDMSFVGPRPLIPEHIDFYTPEQKEVLLVKPGITDLASISFRKETEMLEQSDDPRRTYIEEIIPEKVRLNKIYIEKMSLPYDIYLMIKTVLNIFKL